MSDNDVRVFEATLQRCVERHRRTYVAVQLVYGTLVLILAVTVLQTCAAIVAFVVAQSLNSEADSAAGETLPMESPGLQWSLLVTGHAELWGALCRIVSAFAAFGPMFAAADQTPGALVMIQVWSSLFWFVMVAVCHAVKERTVIMEPHAYVASMNRVLRSSFGFAYDDDADRLVRKTPAAKSLRAASTS
jgi:hypothetical protein